MGLKVIEIILPLPPNRANAREHWRVTHRKKKAYHQKAFVAIHNQVGHSNPGFHSLKPCRVHLTATLYVWNKGDADNATSRIKWCLDSLVNYGLLVDDNEKWLDFTEIPKQVVDRKNQRVVICLSEVA